MNPLKPLLAESIKVVSVNQDQVDITITLPVDYCDHFLSVIDAFSGFVGLLKNQVRFSQISQSVQRHSLDERAQKAHEKYYQRLRDLFDEFSAQGHDRSTIVKLIGAALRKENHPWSSPDLVRSCLTPAGRAGRPGRPRRSS